MKDSPMNMMTSTRANREELKTVVRNMASLGGANNKAHSAFRNYFMLFAYDNPKDLDDLADFYLELGVITVPLALCHTIDSMFEGSTSPAAKHLPSISNSISWTGLSARAAVGGQAGHLLFSSNGHAQILHDLRNQSRIRTQGHTYLVIHDVLAGLSGGTGGGSLIRYLIALEALYVSMGIPAEIRIHAIGHIGLTGANENGPLNDPCVRAEIIAYVTSKSHPMIVRSLRFFQQPALGPAAVRERTLFNVLYYQAMQSTNARKYLDMTEPNEAAESTLGLISERHIDILQQPDSIDAIRANCANEMLERFQPLLVWPSANRATFTSETWVNTSTKVKRFDLDYLLQRHWGSSAVLKEAATQRTDDNNPRLVLDVPDFGRVDASAIDHVMGAPLISEDDITVRKHILVTLSQLLRARVREAKGQLSAVTAAIQKRLPVIDKNVAKAVSSRDDAKRERYLDVLRGLLIEIRKLSDLRFLYEDRLERLIVAQRLTVEADKDLKYVLNEIKEALDECVTKLGPHSTSSLVALPSITEALRDLLELPQLSSERRIARLDRFAMIITRHGLELITNAESARIDSIADAIVYGELTYSSPPLGGVPYNHVGPTIYVLPTMELSDAELLEKEIKKRDRQALISYTDDNGCGAAVVKLKIRTFKNVASLFPGDLSNSLAQVLSSPKPELRFPNGLQCLDRLGIKFNRDTGGLDFDIETPPRD